MPIYSDLNCSFCGNKDMTVSIDKQDGSMELLLCIPCLTEVHEDWKADQANEQPKLSLVK